MYNLHINRTIKMFCRMSLLKTISKRGQGEELDDCGTGSPITTLLLSLRVLTAVTAGD